MSLAGIAKHNNEIIERGYYEAPSGTRVDLAEQIRVCLANTRLYRPRELTALVDRSAEAVHTSPRIDLVEAKTGEAARGLAHEAGAPVAALNFASAKNPGGGSLGGAKAQEEDLARCSALYYSQLEQRAYYEANRINPSLLYTDHIIFSPQVPFFRDEHHELLERPESISIITAPAPNAGEVLRRDPEAGPKIEQTLRDRAAMVLAVAEDQQLRHLVLGAWGCGVFRNDPALVAEIWATHLASPRFVGAFDHVRFAIYDRSPAQAVLTAFRDRFG